MKLRAGRAVGALAVLVSTVAVFVVGSVAPAWAGTGGDNFNRADSSTALGGIWTTTGYDSASVCGIAGNAAYNASGGTHSCVNRYGSARSSGTVSVTLAGSTLDYEGLVVNLGTGTGALTGTETLIRRNGGSNAYEVMDFNGGNQHTCTGATPAIGDVLTAVYTATTVTAKVNGVSLGNCTGVTIGAGSGAGVGVYIRAGAKLDDFTYDDGLASSNIGPPDAAGNVAECNVWLDRDSYAGGTDPSTQYARSASVACNIGPVDAAQHAYIDLSLTADTNQYTYGCHADTWQANVPTINAGQQRMSYTGSCGSNWGSATYAVRPLSVGGVGTVVPGCSVLYSDPGGVVRNASARCILQGVGGTGTASYPAQYYPGGVAGGSADVAAPAPTCSRTLSMDGGVLVGTFTGVDTVPTGATDTYSWNAGDSSAAMTSLSGQHVYPALGSMPSGGWTAVLTVTRNVASGHLFTDGTSAAKTATCSLRVDFLNPDQSAPGSSTSTQPASDCPDGWGWLNPLAIVKILKCTFIPSTPIATRVNSVADAYNSSGLHDVIQPANVALSTVDDMSYGYGHSSVGIQGVDDSDCNGPTINLPLGSGSGTPLHPLSTCGGVSEVAGVVKMGLTLVMWGGGALLMAKLLARGLGYNLTIGSSSGEEE